MLLDVSNVNGDYTSLEEVPGVQAALSGGSVRYGELHARNCGILSLSIAPATPLQYVTCLAAPNNRISTLQGLDAFPYLESLDLSHNALRVLDSHSTSLLCRLRRLHHCDLSHNEMHFVDLDNLSRDHAKNAGDVRPPTLDRLVTLDLSHNQLLEVPDLRCMPVLETLFLDHNRIESLSDLDSRVPLVAMHNISLSHNGIAFMQNFLPLTVLAETLRNVGIAGNPCVRDAAAEAFVRPWLLWLLPFLNTIDDTPLVHEERDAATRLFRLGVSGELNYEAMQVMNSPHGAHLETYLRKFCPAVVMPRPGTASTHETSACTKPNSGTADEIAPGVRSLTLSSGTGRDDLHVSGKNVSGPSPSVGKEAPSLPSGTIVEASATGSSSCRPSAENVLQAMQKKLRQLSGIVEVLWRESMARRVFATIVLQKHMRGLLARRRLPLAVQQHCARIRQNLSRLRHNTATAMIAPKSPKSPTGDAVLRSLDELMQKMWAEMEDHRRMLARRQQVAAVTIQRHYRGHVDRKRWRRLKERYDEFVASLRPDIVFLQRVGRAFAVRKQVARERERAEEVGQLRAEVRELRQCVNDLQATVQQFLRRERLQRYADPMQAMDSIVARHTVPHAEEEEEEVDVDTLPLFAEEGEPAKEVVSILESL